MHRLLDLCPCMPLIGTLTKCAALLSTLVYVPSFHLATALPIPAICCLPCQLAHIVITCPLALLTTTVHVVALVLVTHLPLLFVCTLPQFVIDRHVHGNLGARGLATRATTPVLPVLNSGATIFSTCCKYCPGCIVNSWHGTRCIPLQLTAAESQGSRAPPGDVCLLPEWSHCMQSELGS